MFDEGTWKYITTAPNREQYRKGILAAIKARQENEKLRRDLNGSTKA